MKSRFLKLESGPSIFLEYSKALIVVLHHHPAGEMLGCPKMTQLWKCSGPRADSGAKILVFMEIS